MSNGYRAWLRALLFGACVGLGFLAAAGGVYYYTVHAARQENLTPAAGMAAADYETVPISLTALVDGSPADGMSVSPDMRKWYTPQNAGLTLKLPPGEYGFNAAYENRRVTVRYRVSADGLNALVLDAGLAPEAPQLLLLEAEGAYCEFPLGISGASSAGIGIAPNGVSVRRRGADFSLVCDGGLITEGYYAFAIKSENTYGEAVTWVGLRIPRQAAQTRVYTLRDLERIRQGLSGSYILMNDLDMSGVHDWVPIGSDAYPFTGVFDGGGYTITGFHAPDTLPKEESFSFLGRTKNAEIRNIIFREPSVCPAVEDEASVCTVIVGSVEQGLMENCAVIGGIVAPTGGGAHGLVSTGSGILLNLFNSAEVRCVSPNSNLHNTGGIVGMNFGYGAYLANEGTVYGTHLTGGICGFHYGGFLSNCVNSGYVYGSTMVGEFPPGGIVHTANNGAYCVYGYFVRKEAAVGGKAFDTGVINSLVPIDAQSLRDPRALGFLGSFAGDDPGWAFAGRDARGPVPYGVYKLRGFDGAVADGGG